MFAFCLIQSTLDRVPRSNTGELSAAPRPFAQVEGCVYVPAVPGGGVSYLAVVRV